MREKTVIGRKQAERHMKWSGEMRCQKISIDFSSMVRLGVEAGSWHLARINWKGGKCGWGEGLYMSSG